MAGRHLFLTAAGGVSAAPKPFRMSHSWRKRSAAKSFSGPVFSSERPRKLFSGRISVRQRCGKWMRAVFWAGRAAESFSGPFSGREGAREVFFVLRAFETDGTEFFSRDGFSGRSAQTFFGGCFLGANPRACGARGAAGGHGCGGMICRDGSERKAARRAPDGVILKPCKKLVISAQILYFNPQNSSLIPTGAFVRRGTG